MLGTLQASPSDTDAPVVAENTAVTTSAACDALVAEVEALTLELAVVRSRPWAAVADQIAHRTLGMLSRLSPPLPFKMAARFGRSAERRDPFRRIGGPDTTEAGGLRLAGAVAPDPARQNVLVVTHDATRSGAPILALNLARHLARRYNVSVLSLRGGGILSDFAETAVAVHRADALPMERPDRLVAELCAATPFAFAVVNSAESYGALSGLRRARVPTVTLLHEFAALFNFPSALNRIATLSNEIVFSAAVTRDAAFDREALMGKASVHVIAQGKCEVPTEWHGTSGESARRSALRAALRPVGDDSFLVLGAGTVNLRKGVDLFIETARRVLASPEGRRARFVWVGRRYAPTTDLSYSVYLEDQINRSGIAGRISFLPETPFIEDAYSLADVLLLPSRLDPLPNVGLDAMAAGLPVVCFDRATGLAEQLDAAGVRSHCLAQYLDCGDMAAKVLAFAADTSLRAEVGGLMRAHAERHLDFAVYAGRIEALGLQACARRQIAT